MARKASSAKRTSVVEYEFAGISVVVTYKAMKHVRLRVSDANGQVSISAPFGYPVSSLESLVCSKKTWIEKQQRELAQSPSAQANQATAEEQAAWKLVVSACVPPLIEQWAPILDVKPGTIVYRNMKTRWGSCQPSTGRICINTRLALYPPECLEYVVVHELCHLLVANHGSDFKELMTRVMPDWKDRQRRLR